MLVEKLVLFQNGTDRIFMSWFSGSDLRFLRIFIENTC